MLVLPQHRSGYFLELGQWLRRLRARSSTDNNAQLAIVSFHSFTSQAHLFLFNPVVNGGTELISSSTKLSSDSDFGKTHGSPQEWGADIQPFLSMKSEKLPFHAATSCPFSWQELCYPPGPHPDISRHFTGTILSSWNTLEADSYRDRLALVILEVLITQHMLLLGLDQMLLHIPGEAMATYSARNALKVAFLPALSLFQQTSQICLRLNTGPSLPLLASIISPPGMRTQTKPVMGWDERGTRSSTISQNHTLGGPSKGMGEDTHKTTFLQASFLIRWSYQLTTVILGEAFYVQRNVWLSPASCVGSMKKSFPL